MELAFQFLILVGGLLLILWGANWLVDGSSSIARKTGLSEFVIGLTIVGIGTSTPEMVVSFISAFEGKASMAIGNVIGSNIFNVLMILGITALISPMTITKDNLKRDLPLNLVVTVLLILMGLKNTIFGTGADEISRFDGAIMLTIFAFYLYKSFKTGKSAPDSDDDEEIKIFTTGRSIFLIVCGLAGLIAGGKAFVNSATAIATALNLSEKFIAITIMAAGTSLPELATCVVAARKGRGQLALGNIIGSNISNILLILGGAALINPLSFAGISIVDITVLLLTCLILLISAHTFSKGKLDKKEGIILLLIEVFYMIWLFLNA